MNPMIQASKVIDRLKKARGNPFDRLKVDDLKKEKIRLELRRRKNVNKIRQISNDQKDKVKAGFGKDRAEQRLLYSDIELADRQLKIENMNLKGFSDQLQVVSNLIFVAENKKSLEEAGLMQTLSLIPVTELENHLANLSIEKTLAEDKLSEVKETLESELGLLGEVEDEPDAQVLFELWDSESPVSEEEAFEAWKETREDDEASS
jgi:hypothetical protein